MSSNDDELPELFINLLNKIKKIGEGIHNFRVKNRNNQSGPVNEAMRLDMDFLLEENNVSKTIDYQLVYIVNHN